MRKYVFPVLLLVCSAVIFFHYSKTKEICKEVQLVFDNSPMKAAILAGVVQGRDWHWWYDGAISGNKYGENKMEKIRTQRFSYQTNTQGCVKICGLRGVYIASSVWYENKIYKGYESELNRFTRIPSVINITEEDYICPITTVYRRPFFVTDDLLLNTIIEDIDKKYDVLFCKIQTPDGSAPDNVPYEIIDSKAGVSFIRYATNNSGEIYVDVPKGKSYNIKIYPNKTQWPGLGEYAQNGIAGKYKEVLIKNMSPSADKTSPALTITLEPLGETEEKAIILDLGG